MKRSLAVVLLTSILFVDQPVEAADNVSRWRDEAISAGWKPSQWPWLRCVIRRESNGNPRAYNGRDPNGGSRGLLQINGINVKGLRRMGVIRSAMDLYNPRRNLRAGLMIYRAQGRRAWTTSRYC